MARRGVWQLERLSLFYCEFSGSSRGAREYLAQSFPKLQAENQWLKAATKIYRGQHPFFLAKYLNGNKRIVDLKNKSLEEIERHAYFLKSSVGRRTFKTTPRHVTKKPSIQGMWHPMLFVPQDVPISMFEKIPEDPELEGSKEPELVPPNYEAWNMPFEPPPQDQAEQPKKGPLYSAWLEGRIQGRKNG